MDLTKALRMSAECDILRIKPIGQWRNGMIWTLMERHDPDGEDELAAFYEETRERTAAMITKLLGVSFAQNRATVENLTQEVYLKVLRYRVRFVGQPEEIRWGNLVMMIRNVVSNYRRHAGKVRFVRIGEEDGEGPPESDDTAEGPEAVLLRRERIEQVRRAIDRLDSPAREIVIERYYFERSYDEIAEAYHMKRATVGTVLHRSLQRIGKELREDGEEG